MARRSDFSPTRRRGRRMALTATFFAGLTAWREFKMRENEKRIARPS